MLKLLPVLVLILLLALGGFIYYRFFKASSKVSSPQTQSETQTTDGVIEVPKTAPGATVEDRVKSVEDSIAQIVNKLNIPQTTSPTDSTLDSRLKTVESAITDLKARLSSLEKGTTTQTTTSKSPSYIPLGTGGSNNNKDWVNLSGYEVSLDPAEYSGYSSVQLEVTMRLLEGNGKAIARLLNATDGSVVSSEISTNQTSFTVVSSGGFKIPSGKKTYKLQVKSSESVEMFIQSARLKVNF